MQGSIMFASASAQGATIFHFENGIAGRGPAWCDLAAGAAAGCDHLFIFENGIAGRGAAWCDLAAGAAGL